MAYNFWGLVNTGLIFVSVYGIYLQLKKIRLRKGQCLQAGSVTAVLSIKQFYVSFLAYLSFYIYGYSIKPFNHFIVWPRLIAASLVLMILYYIWHDRRNRSARLSLLSASGIYLLGISGLAVSLAVESSGAALGVNSGLGIVFAVNDQAKNISTTLILFITVFLAYGYYAQIKLIWLNGATGAIELKMSQTILLMDISTIALALSMGLASGWPLLLLATVSGITKLIILYLFRWVRVSDNARKRRRLLAAAT